LQIPDVGPVVADAWGAKTSMLVSTPGRITALAMRRARTDVVVVSRKVFSPKLKWFACLKKLTKVGCAGTQ
jgi:hypothetical protein